MDLSHPTNQEVIKEYNISTFEEAVNLCAHLLWVLKHRDRDVKNLEAERNALGNQTWELTAERDNWPYPVFCPNCKKLKSFRRDHTV